MSDFEKGQATGREVYPGLTEEQQEIVAFGMTPAEVADEHGADDKASSDYIRGFSVGLMKAAKEKGRMIA